LPLIATVDGAPGCGTHANTVAVTPGVSGSLSIVT
jgi:hypothetical protein